MCNAIDMYLANIIQIFTGSPGLRHRSEKNTRSKYEMNKAEYRLLYLENEIRN